jgi:hypothetical protein
VDVLVDAEPDVVHHDIRVGELDDNLAGGIGQREQPLPPTDRGDQVHVFGLDNGLTRLRAHPAARTDHPDAQQLVAHWPSHPRQLLTPTRVVSVRGFPATGSTDRLGQPISWVNSAGRSSLEAYGPTTAAANGRLSRRLASAPTSAAETARIAAS